MDEAIEALADRAGEIEHPEARATFTEYAGLLREAVGTYRKLVDLGGRKNVRPARVKAAAEEAIDASRRVRRADRELAERLTAVAPEVVLASPLLRARETAAAIAKATGAEVRVDERLAPGATAEDLLAAIEGAGESVVAVGHEPDCSEIAAALGAGEREFAPAAVLEIAVP
jgi:phosphohistidine phosphatase SixA